MRDKSEANQNVNNGNKWEKFQETQTSETNETPIEQAEAESPVNEELLAARAEAKEWQNRCLRSEADKENLRRTLEKDRDNAQKFALERFSKELLPVVDSLEKGLEVEVDENLKQGVQMTLNLFLSVLQKFNVVAVDPLNQPFDPNHHEAMAAEPNTDVPANTVVKVLQKGYLLNNRLIRPALVIVSNRVD